MNSRPAPFDELDRKIVTALMANARTSFAEIGSTWALARVSVRNVRKASVVPASSALRARSLT
ncbi:AsnC family transcriptional regulator, partial [Streptomyces sp. NPDC001215]